MLHRIAALTGAVACCALLSVSANATAFKFTSFDFPNGTGTTVNGISNNGDAVGFTQVGGFLDIGHIRNADGTFTLLGSADPQAMANGINASRTVVGFDSTIGAAFVQPNGQAPMLLGNVNGTTVSEAAFGINDAGAIVGQYTDSSTGASPGFLLTGGIYTTLNPIVNALATNAQGVNNHGLVTGFYSVDGVHDHGFFFNSATAQYSLVADPNVPNFVLTQFLGLNDKGLAVGYYQTADGSQHGFLYDIATGTYTFLDDPSAALSGLSITQITGINDAGEIAGFYVDANGAQHGFIATPETVSAPEPSALLLLAPALAFLGFGRRRKFSWHTMPLPPERG